MQRPKVVLNWQTSKYAMECSFLHTCTSTRNKVGSLRSLHNTKLLGHTPSTCSIEQVLEGCGYLSCSRLTTWWHPVIPGSTHLILIYLINALFLPMQCVSPRCNLDPSLFFFFYKSRVCQAPLITIYGHLLTFHPQNMIKVILLRLLQYPFPQQNIKYVYRCLNCVSLVQVNKTMSMINLNW